MSWERGVVRAPGIEYRLERSFATGCPTVEAVRSAAGRAREAARAWRAIHETGEARGLGEPVRWSRLNEDAPEGLDRVEAWAAQVRPLDAVVSIGIGGSYLGNRVLRDGLLGTRWNELPRATRGDRPELHFAGQHLDPLESRDLVRLLRSRARPGGSPYRVRLLAISKSGTTTETLATTLALLEALRGVPGLEVSLSGLTDPGSVLAELLGQHQGDLIPFPQGIGGRWSVLSPVGLVTAAATGVDVRALLAGGRAVRDALLAADGDLSRDPALLYALVHHLQGQAGRTQAVFMPYGERLKAVSEWYVQLLAESLGKARDRAGQVVNAGRTPIVAVGTTDMHAQTQLHQEGPQDKSVTTVDVLDWGEAGPADRVPKDPLARAIGGQTFARLNTVARESNEEALASDGRPSDSLLLERLDARTLGGLLVLLMTSVAYEGELLDVCAYDQPGVEAYKKIMRTKLA